MVCHHLRHSIKHVTDIAFDKIDLNKDQFLESSELIGVMQMMADSMGVPNPTEADLEAIMKDLDDNYDGRVDKDEFVDLVMLVIDKMVENEVDLSDDHNHTLRD